MDDLKPFKEDASRYFILLLLASITYPDEKGTVTIHEPDGQVVRITLFSPLA